MSKKNAGGKTDGNSRDVNAGIRAALALKLRAQQHLGYDEIARQCGFASRGAAHNAVQRELARNISTNVDEMRREELATLDYLEMECLKRMRDEEYSKAKLFAVDRLLAIHERRAKLMGLDMQKDERPANLVVVREIPQGFLAPVEAPPS